MLLTNAGPGREDQQTRGMVGSGHLAKCIVPTAWPIFYQEALFLINYSSAMTDRRPCCNPGHLFAGTALDNIRDMIAKGRACHARDGGRRLPPKISDEEVLSIRNAPRSHKMIELMALQFGVTPGHIRKLRYGEKRSHL